MRRKNSVLLMAVVAALTATSAIAHHSFAAEFDSEKPIKLTGTVTKWEMVNPHSWIHITVKDDSGNATPWMIEAGSPNSLLRLGVNKNSLPAGTVIVVQGFQAKDGENRAVGAHLTLADGRKLFLGGSAPGANPGDAK